MASKEFLETMVSPNPKSLYLKFDLLIYDNATKKFEPIASEYIEQRLLPNGVSSVNGNISINTEQDVRTILSIEVANHTGLNNWGAFFTNDEFKWWIDKRLKIFVGLKLDGTDEIEYVQMGYFIITNFETNNTLTDFPVTKIECSSKEVLFASRRGKFVSDVIIEQGTVMTESIISILKQMGELEENIKIDPQIASDNFSLENADPVQIDSWSTISGVNLEVDYNDKAHGDSSFKFTIDTIKKGVFATKTFTYPVDMSNVNAMAVWCKSNYFVPDSKISLWLHNENGRKIELSFGELVGNVVDEGEVLDIDNWRHMILSIDSDLSNFTKVKRMELNIIDTNMLKDGLELWIDKIYCAEIKNLLNQELTYGAGDNSWNAIKEVSDLLDCNCYYDDFGNFVLQKRKYPQEMNTNEEFEYDAYDVLQPVITYSNEEKYKNLYAGCNNQFDEYELSNHVRTTGGSSASSVVNVVDIQLTEDGLEIREKGKMVNSQGKIRAINQFPNGGDLPTILNGNTNVSEVWEGHKNYEAVIKKYPNGFPHLTEPPIRNFNIQRIGDFVYLPNNASPIPTIQYTYEAKNRSLYELRKRLSYCERINLISAPFFILRGNDIVKIKDTLLGIDENFEVISINMPLNGGYMDITLSKIENLIIDVPYFDLSGLVCNACWYHYDFCSLAFPYSWQVDRFQMNDIESN